MKLGTLADDCSLPMPTPHGIKWVVMQSRVLEGDHILLVLNKKHLKQARKEHPDKVIYFPPEIKELLLHQNIKDYATYLKKIHMVKKELGAWIVPSSNPVHHVCAGIQEPSPPYTHVRSRRKKGR
jgi:hypothetical protein